MTTPHVRHPSPVRRRLRAALVVVPCLALLAAPAQARPMRPTGKTSSQAPTPLMGIAEDIRRISGDSSYGVEPPPPEPAPEPAPEPEPQPRPTDDEQPTRRDPPQPEPSPYPDDPTPEPAPEPVRPEPEPEPAPYDDSSDGEYYYYDDSSEGEGTNEGGDADDYQTWEYEDGDPAGWEEYAPGKSRNGKKHRKVKKGERRRGPPPPPDRRGANNGPRGGDGPRFMDEDPFDRTSASEMGKDVKKYYGKDMRKNMIEEHARNKKKLIEEHEALKKKWQKEYDAAKRRWEQERKGYLQRIPIYRKAVTALPGAPAPKLRANANKRVSLGSLRSNTYKLAAGSLDVPIRDQSERPTCASFAGIRAIELILAQNGLQPDLSEQYFYWASKPDCQKSPCDNGGSWHGIGLEASMRAPRRDIPAEAACPYNPRPANYNETQIPLAPGCRSGGVAKVRNFEELGSLDEIVRALDEDKTVLLATKVTENFFETKGMVTLEEAEAKRTRNSMHSGGHATLAVGYMHLPPAMHASEGRICLVIANSWSEGWGRGGYACLTENWFLKYKLDAPAVVVSEVDAD